MATKSYPNWREAILQGSSNSSLAGNVKAMLVDTSLYTYSDAHEFHADVAGGAIIATSGNLAGKTYADGVFDATDITIPAVSGAQFEAVILFIDSGVSATSRLFLYIDNATGLPLTPSGTDIVLQWDNGASKIYKLGT